MKITKKITGVAMLTCALIFGGCGTSNTLRGTGIGAGVGGAIGAGIGKTTGNTGLGAVIGATVGGVAGGLIGNKMDKQRKELEQELPEDVQISKDETGQITKVTFNSGILFSTNSSTLNTASKSALTKFANNMKKYPDTDIKVIGHTDSTGRDAYNQTLSEKRAESVFNYLRIQGVPAARMTFEGKGKNEPIADNSTVEGRAQNRRVEVYIMPNEKMIREAKDGTLEM